MCEQNNPFKKIQPFPGLEILSVVLIQEISISERSISGYVKCDDRIVYGRVNLILTTILIIE